jgi:hypothetical protein
MRLSAFLYLLIPSSTTFGYSSSAGVVGLDMAKGPKPTRKPMRNRYSLTPVPAVLESSWPSSNFDPHVASKLGGAATASLPLVE